MLGTVMAKNVQGFVKKRLLVQGVVVLSKQDDGL